MVDPSHFMARVIYWLKDLQSECKTTQITYSLLPSNMLQSGALRTVKS